MLSHRATERELIDDPDADPRLIEDALVFMARVNRHLGGTRVVRRFIADELRRTTGGGTLRVLDIGAGGCDIPLAVSRWARRHRRDVRFTCLENHRHAVAFARRQLDRARDSAVELVAEDIFEHRAEQPYDCAVGSMFFHHLADDEVLRLIERLRGFVSRSVLINDLRRCWPHCLSAHVLTAFIPSGVRHDGLLSIRRSFRVGELSELLARLDGVSVAVAPAWFFRVCAVVRFEDGRPS